MPSTIYKNKQPAVTQANDSELNTKAPIIDNTIMTTSIRAIHNNILAVGPGSGKEGRIGLDFLPRLSRKYATPTKPPMATNRTRMIKSVSFIWTGS